MEQKTLIIIILSVLLTAIIVGGGVYFWQANAFEDQKQQLQSQIDSLNSQIQQFTNKNNETSELKPAEDEFGGAGGSGLAQYPPGLKYCKNRPAPGQAFFGEKMELSTDKKSILMNGKVVLSIADLPSTISVTADSDFEVNNLEFSDAVISPQGSNIAFTVLTDSHQWGGIRGVFSGLTSPVTFQFGGSIENIRWSHDQAYVIFYKETPKPEKTIALVDPHEQKTYVTDYEQVISWPDPLPVGILSNIENAYWSEEKDHQLYFSAVFTSEATDKGHAELWSIDVDSNQWDFFCSLY